MSSLFCSSCSWTKWGRWGNLRFHFFVSGVNQVEWGREVSSRFLFITPGVESFSPDLPWARWCNLVCAECLQMIKTMVEAVNIVLLIFVLYWCFIVGGWGLMRWGRKSSSGPAKIASFFSRDFSRINKHDTFWHAVSTGYFQVLFLWAIAVSVFRPLENYENVGLPLFTINFTVNSHADNHL